ncbi:hypothetical protein VHEMI08347 [[Torrubiella] hemipterigena]|uniref:Fatty acid hydroxylase domain-containing protein n=1 Tax=[Torrubiella] hemipterigena TaxID=1531966 RepID=A0A0A1TND1_9HYPO|nr:hypothetical protein VHEMI08347 [[Torrubiella] hemipterigena]
MDVLLSIPLISYLVAPTQTSWSASFNLLFFYMTWATLILSHSALKVQLVGVLAIRIVLWLVPSLLSLLLDLGLPSVMESIKHGGRASLPLRNARRIGRLLFMVIVNNAVLLGVEGLISYAYLNTYGQTIFRTTLTLPFPWQVAKQIVYLFILRETLQYYLHRHVLHSSDSPVAKLHTSFAHGPAGAPFALQVYTDHPVPLLLHRFLPIYLPAAFIRPHLLTYFLFVGLCTLEETLAMSGYTIVPGIIMSGITQRTAIHYATKGNANYGAYGVVDWAHSTSKGRGILQDLRDEAEKHHLQERSERTVGQGLEAMKSGISAVLSSGSDEAKPEKRAKRGSKK